MLHRNLGEDPCPAQAAEVHENVIPHTLFLELCQLTSCETDALKVKSDILEGMDATPTLFLHEGLIDRTLRYEWDLKVYWLNEIKAGCGNPGRPLYNEVFGCQWPAFPFHLKAILSGLGAWSNLTPSLLRSFSRLFQGWMNKTTCTPKDCPSNEPGSMNLYPQSIPCSQYPFLSSLTSLTSRVQYQQAYQVTTTGSLWKWHKKS